MSQRRPRGGRRYIPLLLAAAVSLAGCANPPLVRLRPEPANHAWWLRADFDPRGPALRGLPAGAVQAGWCAVDELSPVHFAAIERDDPPVPGTPAPIYATRGPDVDGRATTLLLAVFRTCRGATGTALVLLDGGQRPSRTVAVEVLSMPAAYAMLGEVSRDTIQVVHCQECDAIDAYRWDASLRRLVVQPRRED